MNQFKENIKKEIEGRILIQNRQQDYILKLQDEIKNAKIVLLNRNMRTKFFEKLQEYKDEIGKIEAEEAKPPISLPNNKDSKPKSSLQRNKLVNNSMQSNFINEMSVRRSSSIHNSQMLPVFTRKISTSRSNCIEIHPRSYTPALI